MHQQKKIFISYARIDGEKAAQALHDRLTRELPEKEIWMDRFDMQGGEQWWTQIAGAIEESEYLVLVMTPEAVKSEAVQKEWRHARQCGNCVCPVFHGGTPGKRHPLGWLPQQRPSGGDSRSTV